MKKIEHDASDWMDAAIEEAAASLTRGDVPAGLRREVLARIERSEAAWYPRALADGAALLAAAAIVGVLIVRNRPAAPRSLLTSVAAAIEMAPLPTPPQGMASVRGALAAATRVPTASLVQRPPATLMMDRSAPLAAPRENSRAARARPAVAEPSSNWSTMLPPASAGDPSATVVQIAGLTAPVSIAPPPLGLFTPAGPDPISIPPIDLRAIAVPPLGASRAHEGDHP